jgi:hypothetical protein
MVLKRASKRIAENQKASYFTALLLGTVLYIFLLYLYDWNILSVVTGEFPVELSIFTGVFMRFLGGLGITLTYTTFCTFVFTILASSLKGRKMVARQIYILILLATLIILLYAFAKIGSAGFFLGETTIFDLLLTISGVWSLVLLVYIFPLIKDEYRPELHQTKVAKAKETVGTWRFSISKSYRTNITRDYGRVYESEFQRYKGSMLNIRATLSGLLLLPIALSLFLIPPLAVVSLFLWIRMFSLNRKHLSRLERGLLILLTLSIGLLTTFTIIQTGMSGLRPIFDASYGVGILGGLIILVLIIL